MSIASARTKTLRMDVRDNPVFTNPILSFMFISTGSCSLGFTRTDLLSVVCGIGLLGLLMLATGSTTRTATEAVGCQNNHRRIAQAWLAHADDNDGFVIGHNGGNSGNARFPWGNRLGWEVDSQMTNASSVLSYFIKPYIGEDPSIFRCPTDRFVDPKQRAAGWRYRIRSYSINAHVGVKQADWGGPFPTYRRLQDMSAPSETFVFLEEHPGSINDSAFATDPAGARNPPSVRLIDVPASFHSRGAHFGFADGHVELHRWVGTRVPQRVVGGGWVSLLVSAPNDPDAVWLGLRAAHLR